MYGTFKINIVSRNLKSFERDTSCIPLVLFTNRHSIIIFFKPGVKFKWAIVSKNIQSGAAAFSPSYGYRMKKKKSNCYILNESVPQ